MKKLIATMMAGAFALQAGAAVISWGSAVNIASNDAQVSTQGTLFAAENMGRDGAATVNGVTFEAVGGSGKIGLNAAGNQYSGGIICPDGLVSPEYTAILRGVTWNANGDYIITISNLTVGTEYLVQIWYNDNGNAQTEDVFSPDTGSSAVRLLADTGSGLGQYAIGTFTADADTQVIQINKSNVPNTSGNPAFNAIQIRQIPEPATLGLMGVIGGMVFFIRRRFRI